MIKNTSPVPLLLLAALLFAGGCAAPVRGLEAGAAPVRVWEAGAYRNIPAACFNEREYLARGYLKNTDAEGKTIYVLIPATDQPKDITFMGGEGSGRETSFGGFAGQFTGVRTPQGILLP